MKSKPASRALAAAWPKSATMPAISASLSARGRGVHTRQVALLVTQGGARIRRQRRSATGASPPGCSEVCDTRPVCHTCTALWPPSAWMPWLMAPGSDLFGAVDAGRAGIALGLEGDLRGFSDDQPGAGALAVVLGHQRGRYVARLQAAQAGEGGHEYAVGQGEGRFAAVARVSLQLQRWKTNGAHDTEVIGERGDREPGLGSPMRQLRASRPLT
jgi:hypothetical protein